MTSSENEKQITKDWPSLVLLLLICVVIIQQTRFLFVFPVPDTGMWFGDESWTMLTARAMAESGVARIPEAVGSSLAQSNGLVNGSIWITGLLYGLPAHLLDSFATPVSIGRAITLLLSLFALVLIYQIALQLTSNRFAALLAIFALVASDAFAFSSHSARFDAATGLAVLAYLLFLFDAFEERERLRMRSVFAITFLACISLAIYVHVPTLIALSALYTLWKVGVFVDKKKLLAAILGGGVGCAFILGLYWATTGSVSLLGTGYNQYYNVANSLPIMHPFSWQVQKINTIDRAIQVWDVAWPLVLLLVIGAVATLIARRSLSGPSRFWLWLSILSMIGWCAFEGPAVFYNIHVLPVFAICGAVLVGHLFRSVRWRVPAMTAAIAVTAVTIAHQGRLGNVGTRIARENELASFVKPAYGARIMADEPALNELAYLGRTSANIQLATKHFMLFGAERKSLSEILREHDVKYLLLYSTVRYQSQLQPIADSFYTKIDERVGFLTDQARSYDDSHWDAAPYDTIRLYRMK